MLFLFFLSFYIMYDILEQVDFIFLAKIFCKFTGGFKMGEDYKCTFCGTTYGKLWRPQTDFIPLLCATCLKQHLSDADDEKVARLTANLVTVNDKFIVLISKSTKGKKQLVTMVPAIQNAYGHFVEPFTAEYHERAFWHALPL